MKKHVIFFMSDFTFGGAGNSISKLCLSLPKKYYKISIICIGRCDYRTIFRKNNITVFELKKRKLLFSVFSIYILLKKIINKNYKNILVSNIHYNNIFLTIIAKKISELKIILVERTPLQELNIYFSKLDYFKKKIIKFLVYLVYPSSDIIIANSYGIKKGFKYPLTKKVKVIYPPSLESIKRTTSFSQRKNRFKIVCFSRLSREKNVECAIKAFKYFKNENITLTIYGEGILKKKLTSLINKLNLEKVVFLYKHNTAPQLEMKKFDILLSPSFFEGCSNTIIEGLNNNLVVIASDCPGGNTEILSHAKSGLMFETNNEYDLFLKIKKAIINFNQIKINSKKYKKNLSRFLLVDNVKKFSKIFEKI